MGMSIALGQEPPRLPDPRIVDQRGREVGMLWHVPGGPRRRSLAFIECNPQLRRTFLTVADQISAYGESETPLFKKIRLWQEDGNNMSSLIPNTKVKGPNYVLHPLTREEEGAHGTD